MVQPRHWRDAQHNDLAQLVVEVLGSTEEMVRDVWHRPQLSGLASILHLLRDVLGPKELAAVGLHRDPAFQAL